jgi:hypothetical protein
MPSDSPDLRISAIFDELLTITRERVAACCLGVRNRLDGPVLGIILRTLYKLGKIWTNGSRALGQPAAILTEQSRANSAKSLSNVSCHERDKKYFTWQNASNAEPSQGKDEPHLPGRGKPILVSAIYFADGTLATALSPIGPGRHTGRPEFLAFNSFRADGLSGQLLPGLIEAANW